MNDTYDLRVSTTAGSTLGTLARDAYLTSRVRNFVERLRTDLVGILTSENVLRVPDKVILGRDDPNLAFYRFQDRDLEIGFYVDRPKKLIVITSIGTPQRGNYGD